MSKKTISKSGDKHLPVFELNAFSEKATWSEFYIENVRVHVKEHAFVDKPHKHDFYLILFVEKGSGIHTIDFVQYPIGANTIFLMGHSAGAHIASSLALDPHYLQKVGGGRDWVRGWIGLSGLFKYLADLPSSGKSRPENAMIRALESAIGKIILPRKRS